MISWLVLSTSGSSVSVRTELHYTAESYDELYDYAAFATKRHIPNDKDIPWRHVIGTHSEETALAALDKELTSMAKYGIVQIGDGLGDV